MNVPARLVLGLALTLGAAAAASSAAAADGLPIDGVDASPVSAPGGDVEYLTRRAASGKRTLVLARRRGSERVLGRLLLPGVFSVPTVAYDGSASGLSADGRTLILIRPRRRFPRASTALAVLDAKRLRPRRQLRLRGDFTRTFRVTEPPVRGRAPAASSARGRREEGVPWLLAGAGAAAAVLALAAVAGLGARQRRRRSGRKHVPEHTDPKGSHGPARPNPGRRNAGEDPHADRRPAAQPHHHRDLPHLLVVLHKPRNGRSRPGARRR